MIEKVRNGYDTFEYPNGDRYAGYFKDNFFHGVGVYHYANGNKFEGVWNEGRVDGVGQFHYINGMVEEFVYENGKFISKKLIKEADPNYEVSFKPIKFYKYEDGSSIIYESNEYNEVDGIAFEYFDNAITISQYKEGKLCGWCFEIDRGPFIGSFKAGFKNNSDMNGYAMFVNDGDVDFANAYEGDYDSENIIKRFEDQPLHNISDPLNSDNVTFSAGHFAYFGHYKDNNYADFGVFKFQDGGLYIGQIIDCKASGPGIYIYPNGCVYLGYFNNLQLEGPGMHIDNGNITCGIWKNGLFQG